jgi:hypothetical protein
MTQKKVIDIMLSQISWLFVSQDNTPQYFKDVRTLNANP